MDQQWQKPGGSRMCRVGDVVSAVYFGQWNRDVSGWTVGRNKWRGTEVLQVALSALCVTYSQAQACTRGLWPAAIQPG